MDRAEIAAWWDEDVPVPHEYQAVADAAWNEIIDAAEAYFLKGTKKWLGDPRAPEFSDEDVWMQFEQWDGYRFDSGAMSWQGNSQRPHAYDLTALPPAWKRAVCERVFVLYEAAGLFEDKEYMKSVRERRGT